MPSRFDKDTIREYFEYCQRTNSKRIGSISALTEHAHKTGNNDEEIREWLYPTSNVATVTCPTCNGTGQIPEPKPEPESACPLCGGSEKTTRYNFETEVDELVPCMCAAGVSTAEDLQEHARQEESRRQRGFQKLSEVMPGVLPLIRSIDRKREEEM